jgi:Uma2 family endonuclease
MADMATDAREVAKGSKGAASGPQPTWDVVRLFPAQGSWSEGDYFELRTNQLVEYVNGFVEFLPMPTIYHQLILQSIYDELNAFVKARALGTVVIAGYKVRVRNGKYRAPDILFIKVEHASWIGDQYCLCADMVIEVVSEDNRVHDIETKRLEYAEPGIAEYWIVDPEQCTITVLALDPDRKAYCEHGTFSKGARATSRLLPEFSVDVASAVTQRP